jgi:hypothetical protein
MNYMNYINRYELRLINKLLLMKCNFLLGEALYFIKLHTLINYL